MTTPQARGDFNGSIMSCSSSISITARNALWLEKRLRSDSKLPLATQTLPPLSYLLDAPLPAKPRLLDFNAYDEERSGKFEHFDKPSCVSDLIKKIYQKISFIILFKTKSFF